jgi:hypothetical protein
VCDPVRGPRGLRPFLHPHSKGLGAKRRAILSQEGGLYRLMPRRGMAASILVAVFAASSAPTIITLCVAGQVTDEVIGKLNGENGYPCSLLDGVAA